MAAQRGLAQSLGSANQLARTTLSLLWKWEARLKGVQFDGTAIFIGRPILSVSPESNFRIGSGVRLNSARRSNPLACFQPCVLRTMAPGASLVLGPFVGLSGAVLCAATAIEIGEGTIIGSGAMLVDNDFHAPGIGWSWSDAPVSSARPIRIGRGAFIGARAIILKGVTIGDRSIVGAGAVVTKNVPAGMMAVGNPARIVPVKMNTVVSNFTESKGEI